MENNSLLDEYIGAGGFNWCGIYECMKQDSFACIPFDEELYFSGIYGQISCIYNCTDANYIDTGILPKDIGK